jgi:hypothetical protein
MILKDQIGNITDSQGLDDLINEIKIKGGNTDNLNKLFDSGVYSYDPHIDWDKLINYQQYYWSTVTNTITASTLTNLSSIVGNTQGTITVGTSTNSIPLSNGMVIEQNGVSYFVEGVGTAIELINTDLLQTGIDSTPEYVTINRASQDLNPWTRHNRWVHHDVITATAVANGTYPTYPTACRARRPIVEFNADIQLYNFGSQAIAPVDLFDNTTSNAFLSIEGSTSTVHVDGVALQNGHRVIFNADTDPAVIGQVYQVRVLTLGGYPTVSLLPTDDVVQDKTAVAVLQGTQNGKTDWFYNGTTWQYAQQHTTINQAPLFDLFDDQGNSYSDRSKYLCNFSGSRIFGYQIGTGTADPVLGFPLSYRNTNAVGSFLFKNYFTTETIGISSNNTTQNISTAVTYFKIRNLYKNTWSGLGRCQTPIIQFQETLPTGTTSSIELTSVINPSQDNLDLQVYINNSQLKLSSDRYAITTGTSGAYFVNFQKPLLAQTPVLFKSYTEQSPAKDGYYQEPLNLTNNPLNGPISSFTLSELGTHFVTMINQLPTVQEVVPLRDLPDYTARGTGLVSNANPLVFAQMFIGKKEHSVVDALSKSANLYNQFKFSLLAQMINISDYADPVSTLDRLLITMNQDKVVSSPYYLSDMIGYGTDKKSRSYTVSSATLASLPLSREFDLATPVLRAVYVYRNEIQLINGKDYQFNKLTGNVDFLINLSVNDIIRIDDYPDTHGVYIPPTPTKLGLYPKYVPAMYLDDTYSTPAWVIQGHDGSISVAFGRYEDGVYTDYRDAVLLEFEKRVYNNIKAEYRKDLFDIGSVFPGAFRNTQYLPDEITQILSQDFIKWAGTYGVDYASNNTFAVDQLKSWNYAGSYNSTVEKTTNGSWRALFKYFYDTDRPHTHPWEMLGFTAEPAWWIDTYGSAPYTSANIELWTDLENGYVSSTGITDSFYARPGLSNLIPVDADGLLLDPTVNLIVNTTPYSIRKDWIAGDQGPAETAWRRSSYWPFAVQRLLALIKPAIYASFMYNPCAMNKNISGQWSYGKNHEFLNISRMPISGETAELTNGYSVFVSEIGNQRNKKYNTELRQDLMYVNYNLFHKVGGFINKNTLQIQIDAYEPNTANAGALLPQESYVLKLNTSNPVKSIGISGFIIQRSNGNYLVRGYDKSNPYFTYYTSIRNASTPSTTVGGISESFVTWSASGTGGATGLTASDTTTAHSATTTAFYQKGQIVKYGSNYYRVTVAHQSESKFNTDYYQILGQLPMKGGAAVQLAHTFDKTPVTVPYGTEYSRIQDVYDLIIGYGEWIKAQGFIFDEYNADLNGVVDYNLTGNEFLYWTTQNWANDSVITLSPFADRIKYQFNQSVVDNIFDSFYEYSLLKADGTPYPYRSLSITRQEGVCTIATLPNTDGIYFARLNSVQKEHAMIFDNITSFGDVIYDIETGARQQRMKLLGFRTANWNGDVFSPGFVYDSAAVSDWSVHTKYIAGNVVRFNSKYYAAIKNIDPAESFDFNLWDLLGSKPVAGLLPNFDYKINQFEDFYSLDIDNFDAGQQKMAQHLIGYTPRVYLNNIFSDPTAQYKFYQGFIREKGTKNSISKLAKASLQTLQGYVSYNEEWAFRVGQYGSYSSYRELEVPLKEGTFIENPQIINFVDSVPATDSTLIHHVAPGDLSITPTKYTSSQTFVTASGADSLVLSTAGYVRIDDVVATAYNENSLLDIANNSFIKDGDTIWLGFKSNGDWDVYRYSLSAARVVGVFVSSPISQITFTTDIAHGLSVGEIVSITQFNSQVDGIYMVQGVPQANQMVVASGLASITNAPLLSPGNLFVLATARYTEYDSLPTDKELFRYSLGSKFWVDTIVPGQDDRWAVYEKVQNYNNVPYFSSTATVDQRTGWSISKRTGNDIVAVGSPHFLKNSRQGQVSIYQQVASGLVSVVDYNLGLDSVDAGFGHTVFYDDTAYGSSGRGLVFAGAPGYSDASGIVKISSIDKNSELGVGYIYNTSDVATGFGSSIFVQRNTTQKTVIIGAPGIDTEGKVFSYNINTFNGVQIGTPAEIKPARQLPTASEWGYSISGTDDAKYIAVGAPGYSNGAGLVTVFDNLTEMITIAPALGAGSRFGQTVKISANGDYLFVSAPGAENSDQSLGQVFVYVLDNGSYVLDQVLVNPVTGSAKNPGMNFGIDIDINTDLDALIISAVGLNKTFDTIFDSGSTILDANTTHILGYREYSGAVYQYARLNNRFVYGQQLLSEIVAANSGTNFGHSISFGEDAILVGAPAYSNIDTASGFYYYTRINPKIRGISQLRVQEDLTVVNTIQKLTLIDTFKETVVDYLDVIDPLKGKIAGIAEQELSYKLASDPAIYSIGLAGTNVDTDTNWLDDHIGELWWDLSTTKFVWYEQSDLEYRKNNWGRLFPGATIDVYEWVGSTYLPSEWSQLADTPNGLVEGVSGQPKFADNSVISVKQVYDNITGSLSNIYYYWVKNKITIPQVKNRRISNYEVASVIADPAAYGLKFATILSKNAIGLANISSEIVGERISLNIVQDLNQDFAIPTHTEWMLLQEGSATSIPDTLLEKKMIDSLLGHDSLGNLVPDPALKERTRYGIGIRPQQTLFKDRLQATRNLIQFANGIISKVLLTGNYNFKNLQAQDAIPDKTLGVYDSIVEDTEELNAIDTVGYSLANIECYVDSNGGVTDLEILNAGHGYGTLNPVYSSTGTLVGYQGPTFSDVNYIFETTFDRLEYTNDGVIQTADQMHFFDIVDGVKVVTGFIDEQGARNTTGSGFEIATIVNSSGEIISARIVNPGTGYQHNFNIVARPHTVVVLSDSAYVSRWAEYRYDAIFKQWIRYKTQQYNTESYWNYIDWISPAYNKFQDFAHTVNDVYQLETLTVSAGQYVKVNNSGDGNFVVLQRTKPEAAGSFSKDYDILYKQNGTIEILDSIWDLAYGFDETYSYDQTLFDQTPDLELKYILAALKEDIFIDDLKINWNLLFFRAVKYALTEQKLLDWAFKTSFISVTNTAGELSQPPVYKLQDSKYYENYIKEVKPYHTQIRNFTTVYSVVDPTHTAISDFDFPATYSDTLGKFVPAIVTATDITPQVRKLATTLKFDRTSTYNQIGDDMAVDTFVSNTSTFELSWLAQSDKSKILVTLDGVYVSSNDWTIKYHTENYQGYSKKYSKLQCLNGIITTATGVLRIEYPKSIELYNATERVLNFYGTDSEQTLSQVMSGIEYPGVRFGGQYEGNLQTNAYGGVAPDSYADGGTWTNGILINALGINPEDIIVEGQYPFVTPFTSYAPEEQIPGYVVDSVGINVYTKTTSTGGPTIVSGTADISIPFQATDISIPVLPTTVDSITVIYNNNLLEYIPTAEFTSDKQFTILWDESVLVISPQPFAGKLSYSIIGVGGGSSAGYGVVDKVVSSITVSPDTTSTVQLVSLSTEPSGALVTVNGQIISQNTTTSPYFSLTTSTHRAAVNVYNLSLGENTVQAWFLRDPVDYVNEIKEQIFTVGDIRQDSFRLDNISTGTVQPISGQAIVEITDTIISYGVPTKRTVRLLPPSVGYYSVTLATVPDPTFPVNTTDFYNILQNQNIDHRYYREIDQGMVNVYKNGVPLSTSSYRVNNSVLNSNPTVTILSGVSVGDAIAVETMMPTVVGPNSDNHNNPLDQNSFYGYNYKINKPVGSSTATLYIAPGVQTSSGTLTAQEMSRLSNPASTSTFTNGLAGITSATIRVITYSDSDSLRMETQRFIGNPNRTFKMDRPILDINYVWVSIYNADTTVSLVANVDFIVLDDQITVLISDKFPCTLNDNVVITSFSSGPLASTVLGYRIFNDILGNTQFTRLSKNNTTYLIEPLYFTDTSFRVADASVLSQPLVEENVPGVVIIAGERIEFFQIDYTTNTISQLRRATLGTGPHYYLEHGTKVIDQGYNQQIPFKENILIQNTFTNTLTNIYAISTESLKRTYVNDTSTFIQCDGIVLSTATDAINQISVYYGGDLLRKTGAFYQETTATYDGVSLSNIIATTATLSMLTATVAIVGDAYHVLDTNEVWVYTGYGFESSVAPGYRYSGIKYRPAEFNVNTQTHSLVLNTASITLIDGVKLSIVKRQYSSADSWNTVINGTTQTLSILDSDTVVARFLQAEPAELPDSYYYGGDPNVTDASGEALTDEDGHPLEGF